MPIALLDEDATLDVTDREIDPDGGDPDTVYTVRIVTPQVVKRLRADYTTRKPNKQTHRMEDVTDWERYAEALWDYVLKAWTGVVWRGAPIGPDDTLQTSAGTVKAKTQLDAGRKTALLERAGANEVVPDTGASFRAPA